MQDDERVMAVADEVRRLANKILDVVYAAIREDKRISPFAASMALFAAARMVQGHSGLTEQGLRGIYESTAPLASDPSVSSCRKEGGACD